MNTFQAYFALLKAYCAINILLLPKSFKNGGWALSPVSLAVSCLFEATCAIKLSQCSLVSKKSNYQDIVLYALGPKYFRVFSMIISFV